MADQSLIAQIAVAAPLPTCLSYVIPADLNDQVRPGLCLNVPLGRRQVAGVVFEVVEGDSANLKSIAPPDEDAVILPQALVDLLRRAADYYCHPPGEVARQALPAGQMSTNPRVSILTEHIYTPTEKTDLPRGERQQQLLAAIRQTPGVSRATLRELCENPGPPLKRLHELGYIDVHTQERYRDPLAAAPPAADCRPQLTDEQQEALVTLQACLAASRFETCLLQGVTGSGKTEVYLHWIEQVIHEGKQALVLVPEIALTPQLVGRFRGRFQGRATLAVLHSNLSDGERYDSWRRVQRGEVDIVIGTRSAVFAPLPRLGAIVVDEEHDASYKQSEGFRYNGRDLAVLRAQIEGLPVLLGSATPSLTSWHQTQEGRSTLLRLQQRALADRLPQVEVVDLAQQEEEGLLSESLRDAITDRLARQEQTLLLLNRRGYSPFLQCEDCGYSFRCPNCEITLTYHQREARLQCHYCDYHHSPPECCPRCESHELLPQGAGTERLEETLTGLFPEARIARMDRDAVRGKGAHQRLLDTVHAGEVDILVGTQMVAKGHDFPNVTLVGVLSADNSLNLPDFRAAERTFALLTQVAGRAGRADKPGQVLIQSYSPDHYAILHAAEHDVDGFLQDELLFRQPLGYPPYGHLVNLVLSGNDASRVESTADELEAFLNSVAGDVEVLGPSPCPLARLRGKTRWQILLKADQRPPLRRLLAILQQQRRQIPRGVQLATDVDPLDML